MQAERLRASGLDRGLVYVTTVLMKRSYHVRVSQRRVNTASKTDRHRVERLLNSEKRSSKDLFQAPEAYTERSNKFGIDWSE